MTLFRPFGTGNASSKASKSNESALPLQVHVGKGVSDPSTSSVQRDTPVAETTHEMHIRVSKLGIWLLPALLSESDSCAFTCSSSSTSRRGVPVTRSQQ